MKKLFINKLDEMQEQKLTKIEAKNFWVLYWLLFASIIIQLIINPNFKSILPEFILLLISSAYLVFSCLKVNVWSRSFKPSLKSNILLSCLGGFIATIIQILSIYIQHGIFAPQYQIFTFILTFALSFTLLSIASKFFNKKENIIENIEED